MIFTQNSSLQRKAVQVIFQKLVALILFLGLLVSCSDDTTTKALSDEAARFPVKVEIRDSFKMSDYFSRTHFKFYDFPDSVLLGGIQRYYETVNYEILVDKLYAKSIVVIEKASGHIRQIKKIGSGPGEYRDMTDTAFNEAENRIYILDNTQHRILEYDISSMTHFSTIGTDIYITSIEYFAGSLYLYSDQDFKEMSAFLQRIDLSDRQTAHILRKKIPELNKKLIRVGQNHFDVKDDKLYWMPAYSSVIYQIDSLDNVIPFINFENNLLFTDLSRFMNLDWEKFLKKAEEYFMAVSNFYFTGKYLVFHFSAGRKQYIGYLDAQNGECAQVLDVTASPNDDISGAAYGQFVYGNLDKVVISAMASEILETLELRKKGSIFRTTPHFKEPEQVVLNRLKEVVANGDAPVLMLLEER